MKPHFLILVTGYNCEDFVYPCMLSLRRQHYDNWTAVFLDDGSTDRTAQYIRGEYENNIDKRIIYELFPHNQGAAHRRFNAIKKYSHSEDDVIVLLGMDDRLELDALEVISREYENKKWMTYGTWRDQLGNELIKDKSFNLYFDEETHRNRDYRKVAYRSTAPNTFRRFLFDQLTEEDFMYKGEWIRCTTESNLMISCLEMCGKEKIGVIELPIYIYNKRFSQSTRDRIGRTVQKEVYNDVINRTKKNLLIHEHTLDTND